MKILIIEDEPATARRLEKMLKSLVPDVDLEETIDTIEESVRYFNEENAPDLVFMDIHLADGNSFEIFEQSQIDCPVIFTTAYDQYAIKAFKVNSIDYLLKPVKKDELAQSLKKYRQLAGTATADVFNINQVMEMFKQKTKPALKRLVVKIGEKINAISISEIAYFKVENKAVYAVLHKGNRYPVDFSLEQLEAELDNSEFFRINRGFIISFRAIASMTAYSKSRIKIELTPPCDEMVITSTGRSPAFKDWLSGK